MNELAPIWQIATIHSLFYIEGNNKIKTQILSIINGHTGQRESQSNTWAANEV